MWTLQRSFLRVNMEPSLVVIGKEAGATSRGPIAIGEYVRLPVEEAILLNAAQKVMFAEPHEQQLTDPDPIPKRGRYRRRDLRAEP